MAAQREAREERGYGADKLMESANALLARRHFGASILTRAAVTAIFHQFSVARPAGPASWRTRCPPKWLSLSYSSSWSLLLRRNLSSLKCTAQSHSPVACWDKH